MPEVQIPVGGFFFKKLKILHFHSQYILSFLLFVVNNKDQYKVNTEIIVSTLDRTLTFIKFKNIPNRNYYFSIRVFNKIPSHTKILFYNVKYFKSALIKYLY